ncbi:MAG TPA: AMP-binding protein, partial [Nitrospiraceae bacterium]
MAALNLSSTRAVLLEWATYKLGCIWIAIPWREKNPDNIVSIINASSPRLFFLDPQALNAEDREFVLASSDLRLTETNESLGPFSSFRLHATRRLRHFPTTVNGERVIRIRFTSGASGQPKGIVYTEQTAEAIVSTLSSYVISSRREVMIHGAPIAWASGSLILPVLYAGGCNVLRPRWDTEDFAETVLRERCTLTFLAPRMLSLLVDYSESYGSEWASSLRRVIVAGGPTPINTMRRARELFTKIEFYTTLGMTEASFPITWHKVSSDDTGPKNSRPYVPLGAITRFYRNSCVGVRGTSNVPRGELFVKAAETDSKRGGNAVAPAAWIWLDDHGNPLDAPDVRELDVPYPSGDIVEKEGNTLHYLCRKDESCIVRDLWVEVEAVEALLCECPGVKEARVDHISIANGRKYVVDVTLKSSGQIDSNGVRLSFKRKRHTARLSSVSIRGVAFGSIDRTSSGKVIHARNLCSVNRYDPGPARHWSEFDFSSLQNGPLYCYVGAGLSMAAGLVGWGEMASLVWRYRKEYESWNGHECPKDDAVANASFLDEFVNEHVKGSRTRKILSHNSGDELASGRTILLNLILRYRSPMVRVPPGDFGYAHRSRWGREPIAEDLVLQSLVWRTRCHGVLTSNYDMLLEHAFSMFNHGAALRSYRYNADFLKYIMSNPHFVLKLHGDINDIGRMQLNPQRAWGRTRRNNYFYDYQEDLKQVYSSALQNGHMIYVGMGFRDHTIERLHKSWREKEHSTNFLRIALIPGSELRSVRGKGFDDILFLTYGGDSSPAKQSEMEALSFTSVREFLSRIAHHRSRSFRRDPSPEATNIH